MEAGAFVWFGLGWWSLSSLVHWSTAALARRRRRRLTSERAAPRPVSDFSIVAPMAGAKDASPAYVGALARLSDAGAEILICVASPDDSAVAAVRALWPQAPILIGSDSTFNPKMNNVRKGLEAAGRPIVALCDAGIELEADELA